MNTSLPASTRSVLDEPAPPRELGAGIANPRELTSEDQDRLHLRELLLAGVATAPGDVADSEYFKSLRNRVRKDANAGFRQ